MHMHPQARIIVYGTLPIMLGTLAVGWYCGCLDLKAAGIGLGVMGLSMAAAFDYTAPDPEADETDTETA